MIARRRPEYAAAVVVASEAFPLDWRVWKHIHHDRQEVDFDRMLADATFSASDRLLLEVAVSLWSGGGHSTMLGVLAERLGDEGLAVILRAGSGAGRGWVIDISINARSALAHALGHSRRHPTLLDLAR